MNFMGKVSAPLKHKDENSNGDDSLVARPHNSRQVISRLIFRRHVKRMRFDAIIG